LDGKTKATKSVLARKCLDQKYSCTSIYSEEHLKVQESRRMEEFWDKQGNMIQEERICYNYCSNKYFMACWDSHKVRMLACLQVLLIMLLHVEEINIRMEC
jgi:hypothetical protein